MWNAGTGEALYSTEDFEMMPDGQVMFASDKEAYLYSLGKFYKLNLENGTYEMLVDVQDLGYFLTVLYGGGVGGNGLPMLLTEDEGELVLLELAKKPEGIACQTVEIAMPFYTQKFEKLVADFERQNPEYDIILLDTHNDEGEEEFYAWKSRIMADISKGEGPDLIGTGMIPLDEAVDKGYLKDVTEWFADDRDRIWSAAWESGEIDGRNYAVPYLCHISTMVTGEQFADGRESWNLEELMQVYEQSGCQAIMTNMGYPWGENSGYFTMNYLGLESRSRGGLIDWENGVSHLKDESTVELLEYVKDNLYTGVPERYGEALASGEIMTCSMYFANVRDSMNAAVLFQDKEVYIGYPVEEGESGSLMSCDSLVVNQGTENEEGVRAFLDYLISEKVQKKFAKTACDSSWLGSGFPVDKKSFEYVCDMMLEGEYIDGHTIGTHEIGGVVYEYNYVLTEESVEKVRRLFETAVPGNGSGIAGNVLYEETEDFFNGNSSAQEVCDAMHNRVQLYLDEQK